MPSALSLESHILELQDIRDTWGNLAGMIRGVLSELEDRLIHPGLAWVRHAKRSPGVEVRGTSVNPVQAYDGELEWVETYRGTTVKVGLREKVRFEIGVSDHFVEPAVRAILSAACTGQVGGGKIFVLPVEKVYRIHTGEEDAAVTPWDDGHSACRFLSSGDPSRE